MSWREKICGYVLSIPRNSLAVSGWCAALPRIFQDPASRELQTLLNSEAVLQTKRVRRWNLGLGFCFLALSVGYFVLGIH
jgi:hypothetical protein